MAASSGVSRPIFAYRIKNNATGVAEIQRIGEKAGQTFLQGTPVQVDVAGATGFIIANPAIVSVATAIIAGFATEFGHNLAVSGVGVPLNTGQSVPNQTGAVIVPIGAPAVDGTIGFAVANDISTFVGVYGDSNTAANAVLAQVQVGAIRGLTKDAGNNFWYVDNFITTTAAGACVEIISLIDPIGTLNGRVEFRVTHAAQQLAT
jgi:hypothetical protein